MGQVSKGWMIWGIIAIVLVSAMSVWIMFLSVGVNNLADINNKSFVCADPSMVPQCAEKGKTLIAVDDPDKILKVIDPKKVIECINPGEYPVCVRNVSNYVECASPNLPVCVTPAVYKTLS